MAMAVNDWILVVDPGRLGAGGDIINITHEIMFQAGAAKSLTLGSPWMIAPQGHGMYLLYREDWGRAWRGTAQDLVEKVRAYYQDPAGPDRPK